MGLQMGIVGLPNVGKSTLFTARTRAKAEAANYPFCTIEPNVGVVKVPDERLDQLAKIIGSAQTLPAVMEFVDIAGLVKGASQGEGMGNQFLSHIRQVNAICHVVRCFEEGDITHVHGQVNPLHDIDVVDTELMLADLATVEKRLGAVRQKAKSGDAAMREQAVVLEKVAEKLNSGVPVRGQGLSEDEQDHLRDLHLLTAKKVLYGCNVGEDDVAAGGNALVDQVREKAAAENAGVVVICGKMEAELSDMDESERAGFLQELGVKEPGLEQLIREAFRLLGMMTYFTAGPKEARAWTIPVGARAPQAAGVIHTDFEKGFIKAEVYKVQDLFALGSEQAVREAGKLKLEGKDYVMQDGDVCQFRFNV